MDKPRTMAELRGGLVRAVHALEDAAWGIDNLPEDEQRRRLQVVIEHLRRRHPVGQYAPESVEVLSAQLHAIYQAEARRQAGAGEDAVRHPDDYAALPEHTKEYDRVLARHILAREDALHTQLQLLEEILFRRDAPEKRTSHE